MHELSLMEGVLSLIEEEQRRNGFAKVLRVVLEVGELSGAMPEALEFCFPAVMEGSVASGAELELVRVPATSWCDRCERAVPVSSRFSACPDCGGPTGAIQGGQDLRLRALEVESSG